MIVQEGLPGVRRHKYIASVTAGFGLQLHSISLSHNALVWKRDDGDQMPAERTLDEGTRPHCLGLKRSYNKKCFRPPAANRIDDAGRRVAGRTQQRQIGWASEKQSALLACPSQGNRGSCPYGNKSRNPGSDDANDRR